MHSSCVKQMWRFALNLKEPPQRGLLPTLSKVTNWTRATAETQLIPPRGFIPSGIESNHDDPLAPKLPYHTFLHVRHKLLPDLLSSHLYQSLLYTLWTCTI